MGNVNGNARFSSISVCLGSNKTYDLRIIGVDNPRQRIKYGIDTENYDINRQHLEPDPENPRYLKTVRGAGYRFSTREP